MLMPKDPATIEKFSTNFMTGAPYVMFAGTDYAHLMIPVEGYYKYTKQLIFIKGPCSKKQGFYLELLCQARMENGIVIK